MGSEWPTAVGDFFFEGIFFYVKKEMDIYTRWATY